MAKEHVNFNTRLISERTPPGTKASISLEKDVGICYCWTTTDGISVTAVCDNEYPEKGVFSMINKLILEFREKYAPTGILETADKDQDLKWDRLEWYMKEWQNPHNADKLLKVEKELMEVNEIMRKNMNDLMKRGETIEDLMAKSKDLSTASVSFYKKAKKANTRCCDLY